jgi:ribose transport system permease protein
MSEPPQQQSSLQRLLAPRKQDAAAPRSTADAPESDSASRRLGLRGQGSRFVLLGVLVLLCVVFGFAEPSTFPTRGDLNSILISQAVTLILAVGLLLALRAGDFDLSIAATMSFVAAIVAVLTTTDHMALGLAIVIAMLAALAVGLINGFLIVVVGIDGFVSTLGMQTLLSGLTYGVTKSQVIDSLPQGLSSFADWSIGPVPGVAIYGWVLVVIIWYVFEKTSVGRYLLFLGGNRDAARLVGLRVRELRIGAFVLCAVIAGFAGLVLAGSQGSVDPSAGPEYLLPAYAAAFLGTAAIQMGRFNAFGTLIALYVLTVGVTGLELAGAPNWIGDVFNGVALIVALMAARWLSSREGRAT